MHLIQSERKRMHEITFDPMENLVIVKKECVTPSLSVQVLFFLRYTHLTSEKVSRHTNRNSSIQFEVHQLKSLFSDS